MIGNKESFEVPSCARQIWQNLPVHIDARRRITNFCAMLMLLFFLARYCTLSGLINLLAQLSDRIHHFMVYNLVMPLTFLAKFPNMH